MASYRMRGSSSASSPFPLEENVFAIKTTAQQIRVYESEVEELISAALHEAERVEVVGEFIYKSAWELGASTDDINVYRQRDPGSNTRAQYRVVGNVNSGYRELMEFHHAESSKELYEWLQFLFHNAVDAQVLQTFQGASIDKPYQYFGIKWAVFQVSAFANKSYQCFVEYANVRKDLRGRDVGVRVTMPVNLHAVDFAMDSLEIKRFDTKMVEIFRPITIARRPTSSLFISCENEFPYFIPSAYTKTLAVMAQNLPLCVDSRRIHQRGLIDERLWVANRVRRSCVVCTRTFGATRGRHHCRLCGDVMCRKCMVVRDAAEHVTVKVFKVVKTKFCGVCVSNLREAPRELPAQPAAPVEDFSEFNPTASKLQSMEYAPTEFDYEARVSVFSETESEDYRTESEIGDAPRSSLSTLSEPGSDKLSFASRLQEIAERMEDTVIEESRNIYDVADNLTMESADIIATIDTKDMARQRAEYGSPAADPFSRGSNQRSLDQCLAEQEALLRQMVMASQAVSTQGPKSYR